MCVFDRSRYGRVLVERVEGFASAAEWTRAYDSIVNFERDLVQEGVIIVKFWMQVIARGAARALRGAAPRTRSAVVEADR